MLERALTTERCVAIISMLLTDRNWTIQRIARTVSAPTDYVERIRRGKQSFQLRDLKALADACHQTPARLMFQSISEAEVPAEMQELHGLAIDEIKSHKTLQRAINRKPARKRRSPVRAA
jgi:transcriptional regulator with XRE-family HTH domain